MAYLTSKKHKGMTNLIFGSALVIIFVIIIHSIMSTISEPGTDKFRMDVENNVYLMRDSLEIAKISLDNAARYSLYQAMYENGIKGGFYAVGTDGSIQIAGKEYALWYENGDPSVSFPSETEIGGNLKYRATGKFNEYLADMDLASFFSVEIPEYGSADIKNVNGYNVVIDIRGNSDLSISEVTGKGEEIKIEKSSDISLTEYAPYYRLYDLALEYYESLRKKLRDCDKDEIEETEDKSCCTIETKVVEMCDKSCLVKTEISTKKKFLIWDGEKTLLGPLSMVFLEKADIEDVKVTLSMDDKPLSATVKLCYTVEGSGEEPIEECTKGTETDENGEAVIRVMPGDIWLKIEGTGVTALSDVSAVFCTLKGGASGCASPVLSDADGKAVIPGEVKPAKKPKVRISAPSSVEPNEGVMLSGAGTTGKIATYEWDFGDGSKAPASSDSEASHTYTEPGSYEVKLMVKTEEGDTCVNTRQVNVRHLLTGKTIVLDPGHGGRDSGATSRDGKTLEKEVNLEIAKKLRDVLVGKGARVVLTRRTDEYIELSERTKIANDNDADLFISIHANADPLCKETGTEAFVYCLDSPGAAGNDKVDFSNPISSYCRRHAGPSGFEKSYELAREIMPLITEAIGTKNRGVRGGDFTVLKDAEMPAVLIETAFICNDEEVKILSDPDKQAKIAEAMVEGMRQFYA